MSKKERGMVYRIRNKEQAAMSARRYARRQKEVNIHKYKVSRMKIAAKFRCKKSGIEFSDAITLDYLMQFAVNTCPLLEIELKWDNVSNSANSPTLDRINNNLGYIPGNVWIISRRANTIKSDSSADELSILTKNYAIQCNQFRPLF